MSFTNGDRAKLDLRWQVGQIGFAANIFMAQLYQPTPHVMDDLSVLSDLGAWVTAILEPMEPHVVVDVDVLDCNCYKKVGDDWNLVGPAPVLFTPGSIGDPLPSGVAGLVTVYTDVSRVQGKKYFPGLAEEGQTAGLWVAGVLAAMLQSAVVWATAFESVEDPGNYWWPGVWSLKMGTFKVFVAHLGVRDVPAYQRRRKAGVGT